EGRNLCVDLIQEIRTIRGVHGVHVMAFRQEEAVAEVIDRSQVLAGRVPWYPARDVAPRTIGAGSCPIRLFVPQARKSSSASSGPSSSSGSASIPQGGRFSPPKWPPATSRASKPPRVPRSRRGRTSAP